MMIRWMIRRDIPFVSQIENLTTQGPWTEDDFISQLRKSSCIGLVVEDDEKEIVGFCIYILHKESLHLEKLSVHPDHRNKGYCTQIIQSLKDKLNVERRREISILVSEYDVPLQKYLYSKHGFLASVVENGYMMKFRILKIGERPQVIVRPSIPMHLRGCKS